MAELNKCEILCDACHKDHHKVINEHGTTRRYWQGCKCSDCKAAYSLYMKEWKQSKK